MKSEEDDLEGHRHITSRFSNMKYKYILRSIKNFYVIIGLLSISSVINAETNQKFNPLENIKNSCNSKLNYNRKNYEYNGRVIISKIGYSVLIIGVDNIDTMIVANFKDGGDLISRLPEKLKNEVQYSPYNVMVIVDAKGKIIMCKVDCGYNYIFSRIFLVEEMSVIREVSDVVYGGK